jgi:hypothetical protein
MFEPLTTTAVRRGRCVWGVECGSCVLWLVWQPVTAQNTMIAMRNKSESEPTDAENVEALLKERAELLARLRKIDATIQLGGQAQTVARVEITELTGQVRLNLPASFLNLGLFP